MRTRPAPSRSPPPQEAKTERQTPNRVQSPVAGGLLDYEPILLNGLFMKARTDSGTRSVRLPELGSEFALQLQQARDALYMDVTKRGWFIPPGRVRRKGLALGSAMFGIGVAATSPRPDPSAWSRHDEHHRVIVNFATDFCQADPMSHIHLE
jgi:hypothetical protein